MKIVRRIVFFFKRKKRNASYFSEAFQGGIRDMFKEMGYSLDKEKKE